MKSAMKQPEILMKNTMKEASIPNEISIESGKDQL